MKIIRNKIIPFKGFKAINLFGILFVRGESVITNRVLSHESIHTAQMKELWYIGFYILYLMEFLYKLIKLRNAHEAYRNISFEKEAYKFEGYLSYLKERERFTMWKI